jgi:copper chaperone CopZ
MGNAGFSNGLNAGSRGESVLGSVSRQTPQGEGEAKESPTAFNSTANDSAVSCSTPLALVQVESGDDQPRQSQRIYLSISGMTCASCVGTVTQKIEEVAGTSEVAVDFIGKSAVVVVAGEELVSEVTSKIEEAGFEAEVVSSESLVPSSGRSRLQVLWTVELAIDDMSSTSYVGDIRSAVRNLKFVHAIDVVTLQRQDLPRSLLMQPRVRTF